MHLTQSLSADPVTVPASLVQSEAWPPRGHKRGAPREGRAASGFSGGRGSATRSYLPNQLLGAKRFGPAFVHSAVESRFKETKRIHDLRKACIIVGGAGRTQFVYQHGENQKSRKAERPGIKLVFHSLPREPPLPGCPVRP